MVSAQSHQQSNGNADASPVSKKWGLEITCVLISHSFLRWIAQPLCDVARITERQEALADLLEGRLDEQHATQLQKQLRSMGDVERLLCRIHAKMEVKVSLSFLNFCSSSNK